ncbi:uncharacterized protein TNCV_792401 [Trichonephila clavipes]|nr:uncharacterized protein TNCV_792401 [Trichonephila clavipes]
MPLVPRKYNSFNNVPPVHFLIDFNTLFYKNRSSFATCTNSAPEHDRLWILAMFNNCRGAWSVHTPDSFVLGVINLLNRKELLISEKESLPTLTCRPSQKFSASSEPHEFIFFSEKLNFPPATCKASVQARSGAICPMETLEFLCLAFRWSYDSFKYLQCVFAHFLDIDHHCQAL